MEAILGVSIFDSGGGGADYALAVVIAGVPALVFSLIFEVARLLGRVERRDGVRAVHLWSLLFSLAFIPWMAWIDRHTGARFQPSAGMEMRMWAISLGAPTLITAGVLWWATRSGVVLGGALCAAALVCAFGGVFEKPLLPALAGWMLMQFATMVIWCSRSRGIALRAGDRDDGSGLPIGRTGT